MPAQRRLADYLDTGSIQRDPYGLGRTGGVDANALSPIFPDYNTENPGAWEGGPTYTANPRTDYVGPTAQGVLGQGGQGGTDANGNRIYNRPTGIAGILRGQVGSQNLLYQQLFKLLQSNGHDYPGLNRQIGEIGHGTDSLRRDQSAGLASRGLGNSGLARALDAAAGAGGVEQVSNARAAENSQAMQRRLQIQQMAEEMLTGRRMTARGQDQAVNAARAANKRSGGGWMGLLGSLLGAAGGTDWSKFGGGGKTDNGLGTGTIGSYADEPNTDLPTDGTAYAGY